MKEQTALMVERLRALLARGKTLAESRTKLKRPVSSLHRLADKHDLPRRRRSIPPEKERKLKQLLDRDESERVICRLLQIGKGTVWRRKEARRKKLGLPKTVAPYRCPGCHNTVIYQPCQICPALGIQPQPAPPVRPSVMMLSQNKFDRLVDAVHEAGYRIEPGDKWKLDRVQTAPR